MKDDCAKTIPYGPARSATSLYRSHYVVSVRGPAPLWVTQCSAKVLLARSCQNAKQCVLQASSQFEIGERTRELCCTKPAQGRCTIWLSIRISQVHDLSGWTRSPNGGAAKQAVNCQRNKYKTRCHMIESSYSHKHTCFILFEKDWHLLPKLLVYLVLGSSIYSPSWFMQVVGCLFSYS